MGSLRNFPYQAVIGNAWEIWVLENEPTERDAIIDNLKGDPGYVPDPRASELFFKNALRKDINNNVITAGQPLTDDGVYYSIDNNLPGLFVCSVLNANNEPLGVGTLNTIKVFPDDKGSVNYDNYNFYVTVDRTTETPSVKSCGIAARYIGTYEGELVNSVIVSPFSQAVVDIFNDIVEIRELSNFYGTVINVLAESSDFRITNLPTTIYTNLLEWDDNDKHYDKQVIPIDDNEGTYDLNAAFIMFLSQHDVYKDLNPYSLSVKFHSYYNDIGSDMLRRNADGTFTNGADLNQNNLVFPTSDGETLDIPFSGGKIQLKTNQSGVRRQVILLDAQGNIVDSAALNYPTTGGASNIRPGSVRMDPAYPGDMSVFLAKAGNNFISFHYVNIRPS